METGIKIEGHASEANAHTAAAIVAVAQALEAMAGAARVLAEKVAGQVGVTNTSISNSAMGDTYAPPKARKKRAAK
jgi:hypothetical protein